MSYMEKQSKKVNEFFLSYWVHLKPLYRILENKRQFGAFIPQRLRLRFETHQNKQTNKQTQPWNILEAL